MPSERATPLPKYIVLRNKNLNQLVIMVNEKMKGSYVPIGGVTVDPIAYIQAMVLE